MYIDVLMAKGRRLNLSSGKMWEEELDLGVSKKSVSIKIFLFLDEKKKK